MTTISAGITANSGVPITGEDVTDYGISANHNPNDPSITEAKEVLSAMHDAMDAAGANGTIFFPEGTYYFGSDAVFELNNFGSTEPRGISIHGAGPNNTTIGVTEHIPPSEMFNQSAFIWDKDSSHGSVTCKNFTIDVNAPNLGDLASQNGGADAFTLNGTDLTFDLHNVRVLDAYTRGIRSRSYLNSVTNCEFNRVGIQYYKDGGSFAHPIDQLQIQDNDTVEISSTVFKNAVGSTINIDQNDGTYKIHDIYSYGAGAEFIKTNAGGLIELRRVYHKANTPELESNLPNEGEDGFIGRHFIKDFGENGDTRKTFDWKNVEAEDMQHWAVQVRVLHDNGPTGCELVGDQIAIKDAARTAEDNAAFKDRDGVGFYNVDVGDMSVTNVNGTTFNLSDSDGTIDQLYRNNTDGVGSTSNISINIDNTNSTALNPNVPDESDVGTYRVNNNSGTETATYGSQYYNDGGYGE